MKENMVPCIHPQRLLGLLMRLKLIMFMNQSIAELYQAKKYIQFWF